tara:strand:- start:6988 stop:7305 length:318 start_codon:yes stop_codon:yes gene_type:complete
MIDNLQLLYGITSILYGLLTIVIIAGAILYFTKRKGIAGLLMIIGSIVQFLTLLANPIVSALASTVVLDNESIMYTHYVINVITCLFSILFAIGFIMAMLKLKKE